MLKASADQVSILARMGEGFMKSHTHRDIWGAKGYLLMAVGGEKRWFYSGTWSFRDYSGTALYPCTYRQHSVEFVGLKAEHMRCGRNEVIRGDKRRK